MLKGIAHVRFESIPRAGLADDQKLEVRGTLKHTFFQMKTGHKVLYFI